MCTRRSSTKSPICIRDGDDIILGTRVARAHAKVEQARQYALHDLTTRSTQDYDLIFIEDPNVKARSRGRNARSIRHASFGEIRRQLTYKSEWRDKILIAVDRWYASSKTCSNCRHVLDELRLDVRDWTCPKCRVTHDRDINAARNLLMDGLRQLAARDERDLRVDAGDEPPHTSRRLTGLYSLSYPGRTTGVQIRRVTASNMDAKPSK
jgi:transposase